MRLIDHLAPLPIQYQSTGSEGDGDCEGLPTSSTITFPPHDPLVLWTDEKNPLNCIQGQSNEFIYLFIQLLTCLHKHLSSLVIPA